MTTQQQEKLVTLAKNLIGKPYKYGTTPEMAPNEFDCSSFTQYIYAQIGITIPRSTIEQAAEGQVIKNVENSEIGDLFFFHGTRGHYNLLFPQGIGHVVMYIGNGKIIHAGSRRIQEKPFIIEDGGVEERNLHEILQKLNTLVIIKRYL